MSHKKVTISSILEIWLRFDNRNPKLNQDIKDKMPYRTLAWQGMCPDDVINKYELLEIIIINWWQLVETVHLW